MSDEIRASDSPDGAGLDRRDLLNEGVGVVGAGAVAAGALRRDCEGRRPSARERTAPGIRRAAGSSGASSRTRSRVAPFGGILTARTTGPRSLRTTRSWSGTENLNVRPALAESSKIVSKTAIRWTLKKGRQVPQRQGSHLGRRQVLRSSRCSTRRSRAASRPSRQVPAIDRVQVVSKYVFILQLKQQPRRSRIIGFFAWQRYAPIVPEGLYDQINVSRNAIGTGPYRMTRLRAERPDRVRDEQELLEDGLAVHGLDAR